MPRRIIQAPVVGESLQLPSFSSLVNAWGSLSLLASMTSFWFTKPQGKSVKGLGLLQRPSIMSLSAPEFLV